MDKGQDPGQGGTDLKFKSTDIQNTQAAQARKIFDPPASPDAPAQPAKPAEAKTSKGPASLHPKKRMRRLILILVGVVALIAVIGVVLLTVLTHSNDNVTTETTESSETTETETAHVLSDEELTSEYVVESQVAAESIVMTYDEKIAAASTEEEKVELRQDRIDYLIMFAASEEGASFQQQVLDDAYAIEDYYHSAASATVIMSAADLFGDEELYEEWYATALERDPSLSEAAG